MNKVYIKDSFGINKCLSVPTNGFNCPLNNDLENGPRYEHCNPNNPFLNQDWNLTELKNGKKVVSLANTKHCYNPNYYLSVSNKNDYTFPNYCHNENKHLQLNNKKHEWNTKTNENGELGLIACNSSKGCDIYATIEKNNSKTQKYSECLY